MRFLLHRVMCFIVLINLVLPVSILYGETLSVFIGSATKPPMEKISRIFTKNTGIKIAAQYGGSGEILSQMIISRQGDVYMPASGEYINKAEKSGVVYENSIRRLAYLIPAINVQKGNPKNIRTLKDLGREDIRIVIANPHAVCIGLYAVEIFEFNGFSGIIKPRIKSYTESGARTANTIAMGAADAVIGWKVFEFWNQDRIETVLLNPEAIPRIASIPLAVARFTKNRSLAEKFISFVTSSEAKRIMKFHGYIVEEQEARKYAPHACLGGNFTVPEGW